jgi:hypothetical protein
MIKKIFISIFMVIICAGSAYCCSVFTASAGDNILFGNNEDWYDTDTRVWFYPATETHYGGVYFGFSDFFAQGGMNDQGLCFDATAIPGLPLKAHPEKLRIINFGERVLEQCATVEDIIPFIEQYDLSSLGKAQFLFADKRGDSVIVCPRIEGEMKAIQKEGVYQVITNFNVTYPRLGGYPCWRYSRCIEMLKKIENKDDLTVEYFVSILKAVYQRSTTYSSVYDLKNGLVYLYNQHNFDEVVILNVEEELEKGYHSYFIPSLFPREQLKESEEQPEEESQESTTQEPEHTEGETPPEGPTTHQEEPSPVPFILFSTFLAVILGILIPVSG